MRGNAGKTAALSVHHRAAIPSGESPDGTGQWPVLPCRKPEITEARVAMRVSQGGHDVTMEKLVTRFPRTMANLKAAIRELPQVWIFDNDDLRRPFRQVAVFQNGRAVNLTKPVPKWVKTALR
jgi:predicted ABC-type ATPase